MGKFIDLTGRRFGRLTVIERVEHEPGKPVMWICQCECGKMDVADSGALRYGRKKSCGCLWRESAQKRLFEINSQSDLDGHSKTRLYKTWNSMKNRCKNPKIACYKNYGGRGIRVCEEWESSFETFQSWALSHGYQDDLTIERIDVDGDYTPENCTWATRKVQSNNRRDNRRIEFRGEMHTLTEWAGVLNISPGTLRSRLRRGWPIEQALTKQIRMCGKE